MSEQSRSARDLVIRNGIVVDGTGADPFPADVAIRDGRIVEVGAVRVDGTPVIEAEGCWVTPGFIDPHTHLDAQLCWDPTASPTNLHGVTSVAIGLCGFGVAPCPPGGDEYLLRSLEVVEEIPYESTHRGVPFEWQTFSEYRAYLGKQPLGVNVSGFVPHSALRYFVMGERARGEVATAAEREAMVAELENALAAGALGLATSRGPNHVDSYGDPVPSRFADHEELRALVAACAGRLWQINVETKFSRDAAALIDELEPYIAWSRESGVRLTWSPLHAEPGDGVWPQILAHNTERNAGGVVVAPQVAPLPITLLLRFDEPTLVFAAMGWHAALPRFFEGDAAGRLSRLREPSSQKSLREAKTHMPYAPVYDEWIFIDAPSRPELGGATLADAAAESGRHPIDFLCDQVVADDLGTLVEIAIANRSLEGAVRFIEDPNTLIALGDSGAHVMSVTNYRYPSYMLAELVNKRGLLDVSLVVNRITQQPARLLGLADRGEIREGAIADLCVIDPETVGIDRARVRNDLPGGSPRLFQRGYGYRAVIVNGTVSIRDDEPTGNVAGQLLSPA